MKQSSTFIIAIEESHSTKCTICSFFIKIFLNSDKSVIYSTNENLTESKPITSFLLTSPTHLNMPVSLPFVFLILSLIFIRLFNLDSFVGFMQQIVFSSILLLFIDNFLCPSGIFIRNYSTIYEIYHKET